MQAAREGKIMAAGRSENSVTIRHREPRVPWGLLKEASSAWIDDNAPSLGAALAFYAIFSLAPVLVIMIAIAGLAFGKKAAATEFLLEVKIFLGPAVASFIQTVIRSAAQPQLGTRAAVIGISTVLIGASGTFVELKNTLNKIWKVLPPSEKLWVVTIRERALSFGLVLATGFLLLVSLALSTTLAIVGWQLPTSATLLESIHILLSFGVVTFLFAMIYKVLPDTNIAWADVWIGGAVTSLLFTFGKTLVGFYLGTSDLASAYGAAGSLVVMLVWIYYSAQIFLFGAEFTHVYATKRGSRAEILSGSRAA